MRGFRTFLGFPFTMRTSASGSSFTDTAGNRPDGGRLSLGQRPRRPPGPRGPPHRLASRLPGCALRRRNCSQRPRREPRPQSRVGGRPRRAEPATPRRARPPPRPPRLPARLRGPQLPATRLPAALSPAPRRHSLLSLFPFGFPSFFKKKLSILELFWIFQKRCRHSLPPSFALSLVPFFCPFSHFVPSRFSFAASISLFFRLSTLRSCFPLFSRNSEGSLSMSPPHHPPAQIPSRVAELPAPTADSKTPAARWRTAC